MKVTVDRTKCTGSSNCISLAPNVFDIDDEFKAVVIDPKGDSDHDILHAAAVCPTKAIIVEDEETGKKIFP